jgi:hypothetical protein
MPEVHVMETVMDHNRNEDALKELKNKNPVGFNVATEYNGTDFRNRVDKQTGECLRGDNWTNEAGTSEQVGQILHC